MVGLLSRQSFPLVSQILTRLGSDLAGAPLWVSIGQTVEQALAGLAVGTVVAVPLGLLLGRAPLLERSFRPIIEFLRPIPSVAILPLVILSVGVGFAGSFVLTTISAFWLVLVMTMRGAQAVDLVAEQNLLIFGVPRRARAWHLLLPSALPFIVTGVRVAASVSLVVAVIVELLGGMPGLGNDVGAALQSADYVGMYSRLAVAGLLGLVVNQALVPLENLLLSWHPSRRGDGG
jgi:NitT/TauT family transport system permease protein